MQLFSVGCATRAARRGGMLEPAYRGTPAVERPVFRHRIRAISSGNRMGLRRRILCGSRSTHDDLFAQRQHHRRLYAYGLRCSNLGPWLAGAGSLRFIKCVHSDSYRSVLGASHTALGVSQPVACPRGSRCRQSFDDRATAGGLRDGRMLLRPYLSTKLICVASLPTSARKE